MIQHCHFDSYRRSYEVLNPLAARPSCTIWYSLRAAWAFLANLRSTRHIDPVETEACDHSFISCSLDGDCEATTSKQSTKLPRVQKENRQGDLITLIIAMQLTGRLLKSHREELKAGHGVQVT